MSKTIAESELDLNKVFDEFFEKYKDSKSVKVYEEQLEWWFKIIDELREENKKLKEDVDYRHHRAMVAERGWENED